jgi:hypothetical protein
MLKAQLVLGCDGKFVRFRRQATMEGDRVTRRFTLRVSVDRSPLPADVGGVPVDVPTPSRSRMLWEGEARICPPKHGSGRITGTGRGTNQSVKLIGRCQGGKYSGRALRMPVLEGKYEEAI